MLRCIAYIAAALILASAVQAGDEAKKGDEKVLGGMSIVGNDEAPKSLAIVPWKGSQLGDALNAFRALNVGSNPVDKEVFMRELDYYEIMVGTHEESVPASQE